MIILSVIVPTRNRAPFLDGLLHSLISQTYRVDSFEVIIVDNASEDNTPDVCRSYADRIQNLRYCYASQAGLHIGRHLGLKEARGDILVYADDDIEAFPTWLSAIAEAFRDDDVALVGGKNLPKFATPPPAWIKEMWEQDCEGNRILPYLSILDLGNVLKIIDSCYVYGCNYSIRKTVLHAAGGFHPDAMPPDLVRYRGDGESHVSRFIKDNNYTTLFHPDASVYHVIPANRLTKEYFCQRAYRQGISDSYTEMRRLALQQLNSRDGYGMYAYLTSCLRTTFTDFRVRALHILHSLRAPQNATSHTAIHDAMARAYRAGWRFHQTAVRRDPQLYRHVLRMTYFSEGMP
jgi:glucosyl-dolichyl phosphate glucuronosyltransferase